MVVPRGTSEEALLHQYGTGHQVVKTLRDVFFKSRRNACATDRARYSGRIRPKNLPITADELAERRKADRRLQLMDLFESIAIRAQSAETQTLRDAYSRRYRSAIGVPPARRAEFRDALSGRMIVPVDEVAQDISLY